jgi:hypothetical protein
MEDGGFGFYLMTDGFVTIQFNKFVWNLHNLYKNHNVFLGKCSLFIKSDKFRVISVAFSSFWKLFIVKSNIRCFYHLEWLDCCYYYREFYYYYLNQVEFKISEASWVWSPFYGVRDTCGQVWTWPEKVYPICSPCFELDGYLRFSTVWA